MALYSLYCADVPLRNCSLTHWCLCFRLCLGYWPSGFLVHCWFSCSLVFLVVRYCDNTLLYNADLFALECEVYCLVIDDYCESIIIDLP